MPDKPCSQCGHEVPIDANFCPICGHALGVRTGDLLVGTMIAGRYLVGEKIGEGGAGAIYRAEHTALRKRVAIKVLHPQLSGDEAAVERFHREATTVSHVENDHMLQMFDFGRLDDGRLYFAMELLEGESLADLLKREGKLATPRGVDLLLQTSEALIEAHSLGYVHRDLNPGNIFLIKRHGRGDFVKLLDFGLSKLVVPGMQQGVTVMGLSFGDPRYLAPEQVRGEALDRRADIYSLGAITYEMLTGAAPYANIKPAALLEQVLNAPPPSVRALRKDCPAWLDQVVTCAMAKQPQDRFVTVLRLIDCLRAQSFSLTPEGEPAKAKEIRKVMPALDVAAIKALSDLAATPAKPSEIRPAPVAVPTAERTNLATLAGVGHPAIKAAEKPRWAKPTDKHAMATAPVSGKPIGIEALIKSKSAGEASSQATAPTLRQRTISADAPPSGAKAADKANAARPVTGPKVIIDSQLTRTVGAPQGAGVRMTPRRQPEDHEDHEIKWFEAGATGAIEETILDNTTDPHTKKSRFALQAGLGVGALILVSALLIAFWPQTAVQKPAPSAQVTIDASTIAAKPAEPPITPPITASNLAVAQPAAQPTAQPIAPKPIETKTPAEKPAAAKTVASKPAPATQPSVTIAKITTPPPKVSPKPTGPLSVTAIAKPAPAKPAPMAGPAPPNAAAQAEFYLKLGRQRLGEGDYAGAVEQFNKAKQFEPNNAAAWAGLGECAFEQGNFAAATVNFRVASARAPKQSRYVVLLGQAYYKQGKLREASVEFQRALKLDPKNKEAQESLAAAQSKLSSAAPSKPGANAKKTIDDE